MSAQEQHKQSEWSTEALREHLTLQLEAAQRLQQQSHDDLSIRLNERHVAMLRSIDSAHDAMTKAMMAAMDSAEKAVAKAEVSTDKRFESVNEFRAQLLDQSRTFLTRAEYTAKHDGLNARVASVERKVDMSEGKQAGVKMSVGTLVGSLSSLAAFLTIVVVVTNALTSR